MEKLNSRRAYLIYGEIKYAPFTYKDFLHIRRRTYVKIG